MAGKLDYVEQFIRDVQATLGWHARGVDGLLISRWDRAR